MRRVGRVDLRRPLRRLGAQLAAVGLAEQRDPEVARREALAHQRQALGHALARGAGQRSEEHTSELQSLMRSSYAVFCLKKKNEIIEIEHEVCATIQHRA